MDAESMVKKIIRAEVKTVKEGRVNPIWLTLKGISDNVINHYASDFYYHDCLTIQRKNPNRFLWLVRSTGTWLLCNKSEWNDSILKYQESNRENQIYYYNNGKIEEVDTNRAWKIYHQMES
jgi:hypothetical protein